MIMTCALCNEDSLTLFTKKDAKSGTPLKLGRCRDCGLVQQINPPSDESLVAYYSHHYRQDYKKSYSPRARDVWRAGHAAISRLTFLGSHLSKTPSEIKLVDIGAGGGEFAYLAKKYGYEASGIEPNVGYSEFARNEYQTQVSTADLSSLAPDSADIITMFHVLEHLPNPKAAIEKLFNALRSGGHLLIEVPNILQSDASPHNIYFRAHLFYFSLSSLVTLTSPFFELVAQQSQGNLRVLLRKRLAIGSTVYPSEHQVQSDLESFERKGWWHYLTVGRGYQKLLSRPRRIIEETVIKSDSPKDILDDLYSDWQGVQTEIRGRVTRRWRQAKLGFLTSMSVGITSIAACL